MMMQPSVCHGGMRTSLPSLRHQVPHPMSAAVDVRQLCKKVCMCPATARGTEGGAQRKSRVGSSQQARRRRSGFGQKEVSEARKDLAPLDEDVGGDNGQSLRPEYQLYADPEYKPQRYIGPIQVKAVPGQSRGLVSAKELDTGELLVLSPALYRLEGEFMEAPPEPEELHMAWMEAGVTAAQRRVLDQLYDGSDASQGQEVSLQTLDAKFWAGRGRHDPQAPQVSSGRLLSILSNGACADSMQDPAAMTLRHQKPSSFIGLWPEYTLLSHSCAPNTAITVIQDRMLIHSAAFVEAGEQLTRNFIPSVSTAPAPQRQAALKEAGYEWTCNCQRCRLEAAASPELQETLQAAYHWYTEEALPKFNAANAGEDMAPLRELREEAETLVAEVEEAVEAEPGLTDDERTLLRAAAYDTYDMLLMCDEFIHQERTASPLLLSCLELLQAMAPGSDSHAAVALKYDKLMQARQQMLEALLKEEQLPRSRANLAELKRLGEAVEASGTYRLTAWVARYGYINYQLIEALTDAYEIYVEGCEQMSIMASQGQQESVSELEINGVKVSVIDKMDLTSASPASGADQEQEARTPEFVGVSTRDGFRVTLMEDQEGAAWQGAGGSQGLGEEGNVIDVESEQVEVQGVQIADGERTAEGAGSTGAPALEPGVIGSATDVQPKVRKPRVKRKQR